MRQVAATIIAVIAGLSAAPATQVARPPDFADAYDAWDLGRYDEALARMRALLRDSGDASSEATFEAIALLTGELYETTELTTDGRNPAFAGGSGLVTYETGPASAPITRVVDPAASRVVAELQGGSATADSAGGRIAYFTDGGARIVIRDVQSGRDTPVDAAGGRPAWLAWVPDGSRLLYAVTDAGGSRIFAAAPSGESAPIPSGDGVKVRPVVSADGRALIVQVAEPGSTPARPRISGATIIDLAGSRVETIPTGPDVAVSADGSRLAFVTPGAPAGPEGAGAAPARLVVRGTAPGSQPVDLPVSAPRLAAPSFSPDGTRVAFQAMHRVDWEVYVANVDGSGVTRVTREIQHDVLPQFLADGRLLTAMGEPRHRRSHIHDIATGTRQRLFHNNTVRTIAPEYSWTIDPGRTKVLIVADRDGDTISTARGVYLVDLTRRVSRASLLARIDAMLTSEQRLRAFAAKTTAPLASAVRAVTGSVSISRIYGYAEALAAFDSKHISAPGNAKASEYLRDAYASFGYQPELQWVDLEGALGGRSANVIATLRGTVHPEVIYIAGSHYDSEVGVTGADDNSSGTSALLETARAMARHPQPATIVFVSFTGEEEGMRGSRPFVQRAKDAGWIVAGTLNNDMIGWTNGHRLDDTIRYTNAGIRDLQHAAAMTFSNLITYDALYYRGSDSQAFYDGWGALGGGLGSYPVLASPHYHQPHDVLEIVNQQLVTEVAKTTAATLVMLSNLPSPPRGVVAVAEGAGATLTWDAPIERDVRQWALTWQTPAGARRVVVTAPRASIPGVPRGTTIEIAAVNDRGLEGWDRARVVVP